MLLATTEHLDMDCITRANIVEMRCYWQPLIILDMDCVTRANILEMRCYWQPLITLDMDCITGANNLRNEMLLATPDHFGHGLHNTSK